MMKLQTNIFFQCIGVLAIAAASILPVSAQVTKTEQPRVFIVDARRLQEIKQAIQIKDKTYDPAISKIEADARKALKEETYSVTSKTVVPPSGDKHDYMSQAPYFWPDPTKKEGLPYIRKDGERNPEINKITDHKTLDDMVGSVENLSLAYYFRGDEAYAAKGITLLRARY